MGLAEQSTDLNPGFMTHENRHCEKLEPLLFEQSSSDDSICSMISDDDLDMVKSLTA